MNTTEITTPEQVTSLLSAAPAQSGLSPAQATTLDAAFSPFYAKTFELVRAAAKKAAAAPDKEKLLQFIADMRNAPKPEMSTDAGRAAMGLFHDERGEFFANLHEIIAKNF